MEVLFSMMWSGGHSEEVTRVEIWGGTSWKQPQGSSGKQRGQRLQSLWVGRRLVLFQEQEVWWGSVSEQDRLSLKVGSVTGSPAWPAGQRTVTHLVCLFKRPPWSLRRILWGADGSRVSGTMLVHSRFRKGVAGSGSRGGVEKWSDSGFILKIELTNFTDKSGLGGERRGFRIIASFLAWATEWRPVPKVGMLEDLEGALGGWGLVWNQEWSHV